MDMEPRDTDDPGIDIDDPELRRSNIELRLVEDTRHCECTATLFTSAGHFRGMGRARRNPSDPNVPMIGEELAIARALQDLSGQLLAAASDAIENHESRPVHLIT